jgi:outer membrane protein assembly factor BamB
MEADDIQLGHQKKFMRDSRRTRQSLLRDLIESRCIFRAPEHRLVSPSGKSLSWLIDLRPILLSPTGLDTLAELFWARYADQLPFQVGGMEMAAVPIVAAILMAAARNGYHVNGFVIHKERKRYGRMNAIEGELSNAPILIVDDIFNTGTSLEKSRVVLEGIDRTIWKVWSVIDYGSRVGGEWQQRHGLAVESVYALDDFGLKLSSAKSQEVELSFTARWINKNESANHHHVVPKSAPRAQNGYVYFGTDSGEMRCVDGASGNTRWVFKIAAGGSKGIWSIPCVTPERVFFGGYDGNLYALGTESGREIWRYVEPDWIGSSPTYASDLNLVFIGVEYASPTRGGGVAAIDADSGRKVWECPLRCYVHGSPLYVGDAALVLCGTNDGALLALDARSGSVRWQFQADGAIKHAPALDLDRRQVVFGSFDGCIRGVDLDTGALKFRIPTGSAVYTTPLIDGTRAYCGSTDKYLYVVDLVTGEALARIGAHSKIFSSPARIGPWIWFGSTNGRVRAIDPTTFALAGVFQLPDAVTSAVEYDAVNQLLVVASTANRLYGVSMTPPLALEPRPSEQAQSRADVTALQLVRLVVNAIVSHAPLPAPERYRLSGTLAQGGAFVSLRNRTTLQRAGRGGQWTFGASDLSPETALIVAATKACANLTPDSLRDTIVSVSLFGSLEQVTPGELDHEKFGVVVRASAGGKVGGALPNSPEYSNERGQYLHALHNARLTPEDGHALYRHTVERQTEDAAWPPYGAPFPYDDVDLACFVTWLLGPAERRESQNFFLGLVDRLFGVVITRYVDTQSTTILLPVTRTQNTGTDLSNLRESLMSECFREGHVLLSLVFKGRRLGDRTRCRGHFRMDRDALICRWGSEEQIFLPVSTMQRGVDEEAFLATLPDTPAATWEAAPCWTWLVTEAHPVPVRGAFVGSRPQCNTSIGIRLHDMAERVAHRLARITPEKSTYLPIDDCYVQAENGLDEYVELLVAFERAAGALGERAWEQTAQRRLLDIAETIAANPVRWPELRSAIAPLILRDLQRRNFHGTEQTADSSGCLSELREWFQAQPVRRGVGLDLLISIHLSMHVARPDLRGFISSVKAGLSRVSTLDTTGMDRLADAAVCLIGAGHRELVRPLLEAALILVNSQNADTHVFVHASRWGGTADTTRVMHLISSAWSVLDNSAPERPDLVAAWQNGWQVIERLCIGEVNAFFVKNPEDAIGVLRDDEAGASASAAASAATLEVLTHALLSQTIRL